MQFEAEISWRRHYIVLVLISQAQCRKATQVVDWFRIFKRFTCEKAIAIFRSIIAARNQPIEIEGLSQPNNQSRLIPLNYLLLLYKIASRCEAINI